MNWVQSLRLAAILLRHWWAGPAGNPAAWLQATAREIAALLGLEIRVTGELPSGGLLVANHLGYLDIIALASVLNCRFVAKSEVAMWPVFGAFARRGGTIFINRGQRSAVAGANARLAEALADPLCIVIFPEGTSSDGWQVLPFHASLLAPALETGSLVTPVGISYFLPKGNPGLEMAYHGEMTLLPHLGHLLKLRGMRIDLHFGKGRRLEGPRKMASERLRQEVERLAGVPTVRSDMNIAILNESHL